MRERIYFWRALERYIRSISAVKVYRLPDENTNCQRQGVFLGTLEKMEIQDQRCRDREMSRLVTTVKAAELYGDGNSRKFLHWVKRQEGFPRPDGKHHLMWDTKAIDEFLDKRANLKPKSSGWKETILKGLSNGSDTSALSGI